MIYDNEWIPELNRIIDDEVSVLYDWFNSQGISIEAHGGVTEIAVNRIAEQSNAIPGRDIFTIYNITDASNYKQLSRYNNRTVQFNDGTVTEYYNLDDMSSNDNVICITTGKKYGSQNLTKSMRLIIKAPYRNEHAHYEYAGECSTSFIR